MIKKKVVVLGGTGMLGSMVADVLSRDDRFTITATSRALKEIITFQEKNTKVSWRTLDVQQLATLESELEDLIANALVINAIGIIKPYIKDDNTEQVQRAILVNGLFPHTLARVAERMNARVIQIATDCVYSGRIGKYKETDLHDATDVYGKTKSIGEVVSQKVHTLRCSIIGPEAKGKLSLLEWFLRQPEGSSLNGFTNHEWNGVTTLHFAKICAGIISSSLDLPTLHHLVPHDKLSKYEMLKSFRYEYHRDSLDIKAVEAATKIDRTIDTSSTELNVKLWAAAGYTARPPTVAEMISEMAAFNYCYK